MEGVGRKTESDSQEESAGMYAKQLNHRLCKCGAAWLFTMNQEIPISLNEWVLYSGSPTQIFRIFHTSEYIHHSDLISF